MGCLHSTPSESKRNSASPGSPDKVQSSLKRLEAAFSKAFNEDLIAGRSISLDLSTLTDARSGQLSTVVSRQVSKLSACSGLRGDDFGSVILCDCQGSTNVVLKKQIGQGGFGKVFLGHMQTASGTVPVAVKAVVCNRAPDSLESDQHGMFLENYEQELEDKKERMAQLEAVLMSVVAHPNVVRTYKVMSSWAMTNKKTSQSLETTEQRDSDPLSQAYEWHIVMEYCSLGCLWTALRSRRFHKADFPAQQTESGPDTTKVTVTWDAWAVVETLREVADALEYLHEHGIQHGDIKAANILLAASEKDRRKFVAKVSDFGFARIMGRNNIKTRTYGTVTHMPPELLGQGVLTPGAADVYAFGILMWECYMAQGAFKQLNDAEVIFQVVGHRLRPEFPANVPPRYKRLAEQCWSQSAADRPTIASLKEQLAQLQQELCPKGPSSTPHTFSQMLHTTRRMRTHNGAMHRVLSADNLQGPSVAFSEPASIAVDVPDGIDGRPNSFLLIGDNGLPGSPGWLSPCSKSTPGGSSILGGSPPSPSGMDKLPKLGFGKAGPSGTPRSWRQSPLPPVEEVCMDALQAARQTVSSKGDADADDFSAAPSTSTSHDACSTPKLSAISAFLPIDLRRSVDKPVSPEDLSCSFELSTKVMQQPAVLEPQ